MKTKHYHSTSNAVAALALLLVAAGSALAQPQTIATDSCTAVFEEGTLVRLSDTAGRTWAAFDGPLGDFACLHRIDATATIEEAQTHTVEAETAGWSWRRAEFPDLPGTWAQTTVTSEADEIVVRQEAVSPQQNLWGVEWSVAGIPLDRNIIVPGHSGVRLTEATPGRQFTFEYPMTWEAQLAIVEGVGSGFYVWAQDPETQFKRLIVERRRSGWRLRFVAMAYAPFEESSRLVAPEWRLGVYEGDWRVPARRYRDWMLRTFDPTPVEQQHPSWVKDMRCLVVIKLDLEMLEQLGKMLDPAQTLLYVPGWRTPGYDRDYPNYSDVYPELKPFIDRAHELGFKVMLHVNYFGVDPLNALYEQFEPYQVRSPWAPHEKEWWLWTRATPEIKFAYINPACSAWRDLFTECMVRLCESSGADALHLDQTLCIYNDYNGRIEGMTMAEGNIALHRQLREALPEVALSGEGLNEITCAHEAFAQRHVWGLQHVEGTWNRALLEAAHPISSYLFRPYTVITGYLGCAPPASGQLYAAWNEAYEHWGVIPTLKLLNNTLDHPNGFMRQFQEEVAFWFEARPEIALEGPWPDTVAFPYRAADGKEVLRTTDHRLLLEGREISRTISGVNATALPGSIPGWQTYDATRLFGLSPDAWYPYFDEPRDLSRPHLSALPDDYRPESLVLEERLGILRTVQRGALFADIPALLGQAERGSRLAGSGERPFENEGPSPDGAFFEPHGDILHIHPPWKDGIGAAYARFDLSLPDSGSLYFESAAAMDQNTVGLSDGATFTVRAESQGETLEETVHTAGDTPVPLQLELTPFAGRTITLELAVDPGPENDPSYDWARWHAPRIMHRLLGRGTIEVAGAPEYTHAAAGGKVVPVRSGPAGLAVEVPLPGAIYFIDQAPAAVNLPLDLAAAPFTTAFLDTLGHRLEAPPHATARPGEGQVEGQLVQGLFVHPPNDGMTVLVYSVLLPPAAATFEASAGLRDGADHSDGAECMVEINGQQVASARVAPGEGLRALHADLSPWAGQPAVIALITASAGSCVCDWVLWDAPVIREAP